MGYDFVRLLEKDFHKLEVRYIGVMAERLRPDDTNERWGDCLKGSGIRCSGY